MGYRIVGVLVLSALAGFGCGKEDDDEELDPTMEGADPSSGDQPPGDSDMLPGTDTLGSDAASGPTAPAEEPPKADDTSPDEMRPGDGFNPGAWLDGGSRFPGRPGRDEDADDAGEVGRDRPERGRSDAGRGRPGPRRDGGFPEFDRDAGRPGFPEFDRDAGRPGFPGRSDGGRPRPGGGPRGGQNSP